MQITYVVIVTIITYIFGAITKMFIDVIPNKYIPIQNVLIGIISGLICYFIGVEPNIITSLVLCFMSAIGAGGIADLTKITKKEK